MSEIEEIRERWDEPLVARLRDAAMVLAAAPLEMDRDAGLALSRDCEEAVDHIEKLEACSLDTC